jgi:hypothetical protein
MSDCFILPSFTGVVTAEDDSRLSSASPNSNITQETFYELVKNGWIKICSTTMPRQDNMTVCLRVKTAQNSQRSKANNAVLLICGRAVRRGSVWSSSVTFKHAFSWRLRKCMSRRARSAELARIEKFRKERNMCAVSKCKTASRQAVGARQRLGKLAMETPQTFRMMHGAWTIQSCNVWVAPQIQGQPWL